MVHEWLPETIAAAIALIALLVSGVSVGYARHANELAKQANEVAKHANDLVGVYRRAIWIPSVELRPAGSVIISFLNRGDSPGQYVGFTLDADPQHTFTEDTVHEYVAKDEVAEFAINTPIPTAMLTDNLLPAVAEGYRNYFVQELRRRGRLSWTDLEGGRRTQEVMLPNGVMVAQPSAAAE